MDHPLTHENGEIDIGFLECTMSFSSNVFFCSDADYELLSMVHAQSLFLVPANFPYVPLKVLHIIVIDVFVSVYFSECILSS